MIASVLTLLSLCLAFCVYGLPVDMEISRRQPSTSGNEFVQSGMNPQMLGGGFEGDMIFSNGFDPTDSSRGAAIYGNMKWPNGIIPYDMSTITNAQDKKKITDAMMMLTLAVGNKSVNTRESSPCVSFRTRQVADKIYLKIQYGTGCSSTVGYNTGIPLTVTLQQNGCFYTRTIQHELMHVIGFFHEQSRPDRDEFLQINLQNVKSDMTYNFDKYAWGSTVLNQGSKYDYASIMHYETTAFSMNGKPTVIPRQSGVTIGKAEVLSPTDIAEVRHLYGCKA